jgi:hypothetical protein
VAIHTEALFHLSQQEDATVAASFTTSSLYTIHSRMSGPYSEVGLFNFKDFRFQIDYIFSQCVFNCTCIISSRVKNPPLRGNPQFWTFMHWPTFCMKNRILICIFASGALVSVKHKIILHFAFNEKAVSFVVIQVVILSLYIAHK